MSLERRLFAPVERVASALYPRRFRFALTAAILVVLPFVLVLIAQRTWPWPAGALRVVSFVPSITFSASALCLGAFLLAGWFAPSARWFMPPPNHASHALDVIRVLLRSWALVVLLLMAAVSLFFLFGIPFLAR